jgi:hypothetical protein
MTYYLSIHMLERSQACDMPERVADLNRVLGREVRPGERIPLTVWWGLPSTSATDRVWSLRCFEDRGAEVAKEVALRALKRARGYAMSSSSSSRASYYAGLAEDEEKRLSRTYRPQTVVDTACQIAIYALYAARLEGCAEEEKQIKDLEELMFSEDEKYVSTCA